MRFRAAVRLDSQTPRDSGSPSLRSAHRGPAFRGPVKGALSHRDSDTHRWNDGVRALSTEETVPNERRETLPRIAGIHYDEDDLDSTPPVVSSILRRNSDLQNSQNEVFTPHGPLFDLREEIYNSTLATLLDPSCDAISTTRDGSSAADRQVHSRQGICET